MSNFVTENLKSYVVLTDFPNKLINCPKVSKHKSPKPHPGSANVKIN